MTQETWGSIVEKAREEGGFELIPPSTYDWQIVAADPGNSSNGNPRIRVKLVILSGPMAGKPAWKDLIFMDTTMGIRVQELEALDIDPRQYQGTIEQVMPQLAPALLNKTLTAPLNHRPWQGQMRNDVGIFRKRGAGSTPAAPVPGATQSGTPTTPAPVATAPAPVGLPEAAPPPPPAETAETPF